MSKLSPTFSRQQPRVDEPSATQEEIIYELWEFMRGLYAEHLRMPGGESGAILMQGVDGLIRPETTLTGGYTFTSLNVATLTVTSSSTLRGTTDIGRDLTGLTTIGMSTNVLGDPTNGLRFDDAVGFFGYLVTPVTGLTADRAWQLPDSGTTAIPTQLVGSAETVTLTNKTLSTNTNLQFVASSDTRCIFQDSASITKQLGLTLSGLTSSTNSFLSFVASAARTWTFGDYSGNVAIDAGVICYEDEVMTYEDDLLVA